MCTHTNAHTRAHTHTSAYKRTHIHSRRHKHTRTHIHVHTHTCAHTRVVYVCMCVCLFQFEGSNLSQLVLRICRGRYTPVSEHYSTDLRLLLKQLFKVSPRDRPSVNSILKLPLLHVHISKHLQPQVHHRYDVITTYRSGQKVVNDVTQTTHTDPCVCKKNISSIYPSRLFLSLLVVFN